MVLLLVLSGISSALEQAINKNSRDSMSLFGVLAFAIIGGALLGRISYYFVSLFIVFQWQMDEWSR